MKDFVKYFDNLHDGMCTVQVSARCCFCSGDRLCGSVCAFIANRQYLCNLLRSWRVLSFFIRGNFYVAFCCWPYSHYVCCGKIRIKMVFQKKSWRKYMGEKLKTNHRLWGTQLEPYFSSVKPQVFDVSWFYR